MKPESIVMFGRLWLLSILFGIAGAWIMRARIQAILEGDPRTAPVAHWALPGLTGLTVIVSLLLWYMIRQRSLTAKWLALLVAIVSAGRGLLTLIGLIGVQFRHPVSSALLIACSVATVAAVALLFRPDARLWFGEDGMGEPVAFDPDDRA